MPEVTPEVGVAGAFSKQAPHFDLEERQNPILNEWRKQIYDHVNRYIRPPQRILELNAGTGLDAIHFVNSGNQVHATDLSAGMISEIKKKIYEHGVEGKLTCQQVSFENLDQVLATDFDFVFSNFGGLNCTRELEKVTRFLKDKVKLGGYVTWVIMPPYCPWEWTWILKGQWREATRRFRKSGSLAHLEGDYFTTYYYSVSDVRRAFGDSFRIVQCEGLGVFKAPPSATSFWKNYTGLYYFLKRVDSLVKDFAPFNRFGDHVIITLQKK